MMSFMDPFGSLGSLGSEALEAFLAAYAIGWILGIGLSIGLAFIPANIAAKKGYSKVGFWFFGFGAFVPAIIVACCLRNKNA